MLRLVKHLRVDLYGRDRHANNSLELRPDPTLDMEQNFDMKRA
jgi:hypothetical protein